MANNVKHVNQDTMEQVLTSGKPVLMDFYADWCGPCKMISPIIEQLAAEYNGKAEVAKLNVDQNNALAARYGVMSIPTLLFFKDGKEVNRIVGARPKAELSRILDQLM